MVAWVGTARKTAFHTYFDENVLCGRRGGGEPTPRYRASLPPSPPQQSVYTYRGTYAQWLMVIGYTLEGQRNRSTGEKMHFIDCAKNEI